MKPQSYLPTGVLLFVLLYFLIKSETNLPVNIPAQQLRSIRVEHFQATMLFPVELREVCYVCGIILYPYAASNVASCDTGTGNMAAWLVTCVYVPCFVVVIGRK